MNYQMMQNELKLNFNFNSFKFLKNCTKLGYPYYLVLFVNHTKPGTVLTETVLSGESLYLVQPLSLLLSYKIYKYISEAFKK